MGIIIAGIVSLCLFIICLKTDSDNFAAVFMILTIAFFFAIVGIGSSTNDDRVFIKENYDDLNSKISNNSLSLKDVNIVYEINKIIKDNSSLKNDIFIGVFYSKEFDRPIIQVPDLYSKDSIKINGNKTEQNGLDSSK